MKNRVVTLLNATSILFDMSRAGANDNHHLRTTRSCRHQKVVANTPLWTLKKRRKRMKLKQGGNKVIMKELLGILISMNFERKMLQMNETNWSFVF